MKEEYKKEVVKLSDVLNNIVLKYMAERFPDIEDTAHFIDFVLSVHLSSAFRLMTILSSEHPKIKDNVEKFIDELQVILRNIHPITKIETIHEGLN